MSPITQIRSTLLDWSAQGLFVAPDDSLERYVERAHLLLKASGAQGTEAARAIVRACYEADPLWVEVIFSDKDLALWEAGCTWCGVRCDEPPQIHLRSAFEKKKRFLWLYDRDEILAHEYVHAIRSPLDSTVFEEFFAYYTSIYSGRGYVHYFRALLGPLFGHPREPLFLIASLGALNLLLLLQMWFFDDAFFWEAVSLIVAIPLLFVGRLALRWRSLYRCKKRLEAMVGGRALALMVRLTDEEILLFSKLSVAQIKAWIAEKMESSFRWELYNLMYSNSK